MGKSAMRRRAGVMLSSALLIAAITGCGGGGGGTTENAAGGTQVQNPISRPVTLQGVVAVGKPLAGYTVRIYSIGKNPGQGMGVEETTTDAQGRYTLTITSELMEPPFAIMAVKYPVSGVYPRLFSFASKGGTVNITPLTSLLVAQLLQRPQESADFHYGSLSALKSVTEADIAAARQKVLDYLRNRPHKLNRDATAPIDASAIADFIGMPFQPVAGDVYDDVLEKLGQSLIERETLIGLEERLLNSNAPLPDLAALPADARIRCAGNVCGRAVPAMNEQIDTPYFSKSSLIAQIEKQMLNWPYALMQMDCGPSPQIRGFRPGINTVSIKNGVMRINSPLSGDSTDVDLASLDAIRMNVGQLSSTRYLSSFHGTSSVNGLDSTGFGVGFNSEGQISGFGVSEKQGDVWKSVSCTNTTLS